MTNYLKGDNKEGGGSRKTNKIKKERSMMNIELHGFQTNDWSHIIASIFTHLTTADKNVSTETVVTTVQSVTEDGAGTKQPFIRVFSDDKSDFEIARKILPHVYFPGFYHRDTRPIVMECVLLAACLKV